MGDSYTAPASVANDILRSLFSALDRPAYWLLGIMYELFFNVASADLFSNSTIMKFYGRVQIILGVFMMFQLSMTILKGIVNPDSFTDSKTGGGNLITRIFTALILITVLMPINIPGAANGNEYEKQINNNGLLFGTLYSLQHRILSNNTLGRLVLGTNSSEATFKSTPSGTDSELKKSARIFTSTVLKGFYRINLVPEGQRKDSGTKDPATINENRVCTDIDDAVLEAYTRIDADPGDIISMVNATCDSKAQPGFLNNLWTGTQKLTGSTKYVFAYMPVVSFIVPVIFVFILLSFTIDVAVRAVKLAVLRLIAPIPIISYMDPKGSKDSAFNSWVKALSSTYLDLFIRLAVVYFVIFLIQDMIVNGIIIDNGEGVIGILSWIILVIGLFVFAKQAPKFIKQVLGLKDDGFKLFSGFSEAIGFGATALGTIGSFNAARTASEFSDIAQHRNEKAWYNRGRQIIAGIGGGIAGATAGVNAWAGAKGQVGKTVMDAINKRNATDIQRGASGSTLFGRMSATGHRLFQGEGATSFDSKTREAAQKESIEKSAKDLFSYLEGKGKSDGAGYKVQTAKFSGQANGVDFNDRQFTGTLNDLLREKQKAIAAQQAGTGNGTFVFDGMTFSTTDASVQKLEDELAYAAGDMWAQNEQSNHEAYEAAKQAHPEWDEATLRSHYKDGDSGYLQKQATYNESIYGAKDDNKHGLYTRYTGHAGDPKQEHSASRLKKTSKAAGGEAGRIKNSDAYKKQQADYGATKK